MDSEDKFQRTSVFTRIALVFILIFLVGDVRAVLIPAIQAAKNK